MRSRFDDNNYNSLNFLASRLNTKIHICNYLHTYMHILVIMYMCLFIWCLFIWCLFICRRTYLKCVKCSLPFCFYIANKVRIIPTNTTTKIFDVSQLHLFVIRPLFIAVVNVNLTNLFQHGIVETLYHI